MDIGAWLKRIGFDDYIEVFAENGIDAEMLLEITNEDLKDMGIARLADRKRLLRAIAELDRTDSPSRSDIPSAVAAGRELRQVTVLFADLSDFTRLSNTLGAEQTHALLNRFFKAVDDVVKSYGGTIDKHIGDAVMAVFGVPIAHTDDPERAGMAALEIHKAICSIEPPLKVHIGIASGQVVASETGSSVLNEYTVTGDSVNLASRLTDLAAPSETLVSDAVRAAMSPRFEGTLIGTAEVKGLRQPTPIWRLEKVAARNDRREHPFVGRLRELKQIRSAIEGCLESGLGQSIYIRGEAGIGKTRLVEEAQRLAEEMGFQTHTGLVLDFGVAKGQDAIRALVRSLLDLRPASSKDLRLATAAAAVNNGLIARDQQIYLNDLLDLEQPPDLKSIHDAMDSAIRIRGQQETFSALVRNRCQAAPLLLKVEDVHWAKPALLSQLAHLAATVGDIAAVLLMTSRIDSDQLNQAWRSTVGVTPITTIDLGPLRLTEARALSQDFPGVSSAFAQICVERAGGNPLFLEQLLRSPSQLAEKAVPGSIQSIVQARTDTLPARDRKALQSASVLGQRFAVDALRHLLSDGSYQPDILIAHNLVRPYGDELIFAHALIREAIYASLLESRRKTLHEMTAAWFTERDAVLRAEHLYKADSPSAADAFLDAAQWLIRRNQYDRAAEVTEQALSCATTAVIQHALLCLQGSLRRELGNIPGSLECFSAAIGKADDDIAKCEAWIGLAFAERLAEHYANAVSALQKAEAYAVKHHLAKQLAEIHYHRASVAFRSGDLDGCLAHSERALQEARTARSSENEARALSVLGDAYYMRGQMMTAHKNYDLCVEKSRENNFGRVEVANLHMRGLTRYFKMDLEGALRDSDRSVAMAKAVGQDRAAMIASGIKGGILIDMADLNSAEEAFEAALEKARYLGARSYEPFSFASLARIRYAQGRHRECLELAREAVAISREVGARISGPRALGTLALFTDNDAERCDALRDGQALLDEGCISHHYFSFYRDGMEGALRRRAFDELEYFADRLDAYTRSEPSPLTDFFISRGRILAAIGKEECDQACLTTLQRLRDQAAHHGLRSALPALEAALAGE